MKKLNYLDNLKMCNNIYKIDKSYKIEKFYSFDTDINIKRGKRYDYTNMILPKHATVHSDTKWLNELEKRYCNLYKNAFLIIYFLF